MSRIYFKPLPDESTPATAERINGLLNGEESIEKIVVGSIEGKNLFDKNTAPILGVYINANSNQILSSDTIKSTYIKCESNTTYTISKKAGRAFRWGTTATKPAVGVSVIATGANHTGTSITVTTGATVNYLVVTFYDSSTDTDTLQELINSIQIEKGSSATEYDEYMKYGYNEDTNMGKLIVEKISGKNLFNGVLTLGAINSNGVDFSDNNSIRSVGYTKVKPNTTYTLNSLDNIKNIVYFYDSNKAFISNIGNNVSLHTFTTPSNCEYLRFCTYVSEGATNINSKFQLELGLQATSYEDFNTTQMGNIVVDDVTCKNILNLVNKSGTVNGITYVWEGTKLKLNGTATVNTNIYNIGSWGSTIPYFQMKAGSYTSSITGASNINRFAVYILGGNDGTLYLLSHTNTTQKITTILSEDYNACSYYINIPSGATFNNETFYLQLERGSQATNYTTHKEFDNSEMQLYSSNEIIIGKDNEGKPVYRKTFNITNPSSSNTDYYDVSDLNIKKVFISGSMTSATGIFPVPMYDSSNNYSVIFVSSSNKLRGRFVSGGITDITINLDYTKTTD